MLRLTHLPALRLLIPFASGLLIGIGQTTLLSFLPFALYVFLIGALLVSLYRSKKHELTRNRVLGFLIWCCLFMSGYYYGWIRVPLHRYDHYSNHQGDSAVVRLVDHGEVKNKNRRYQAEVLWVEQGSAKTEVSGKLLVYVRTDSLLEVPVAGDLLSLRYPFVSVQGAANPGGFDYRKYLASQGIYHQAYVQVNQFRQVGNKPLSLWQRWVLESANRVVKILDEHIENPDQKAVGLALIMGDRSLLHSDLLEIYSQTGTMHILAVSGLHVGILYVILEWILGLIPMLKRKDFLRGYARPVLILICIWFYASMTGMSPSVFRSAVMFSFLALGKPSGRYIHSVNILAASALTLLLIDPLMILQIGFQLSFLAVAGIITWQPFMARLWLPKNRFSAYFWSIITVSVAAQLGTAPITMYYFHTFPNYFLLSNCLAIPVSFVILSAGLFLIPLHAVPGIGWFIAELLEGSLWLMDFTLSSIARLPGALTHHIYWTLILTLCAYFFILFIYFYLNSTYFNYLAAALLVLSSGFFYQYYHNFKDWQNPTLMLYALPGETAIGYRYHEDAYLICRDSIVDSRQIQQEVWPTLSRSWTGLPQVQILPDSGTHSCWNIAGNHLLVAQSGTYDLPNCEPDHILVTRYARVRFDSLARKYPKAEIILDKSNSWGRTQYLEKYLALNYSYWHNMYLAGYKSLQPLKD